MKIGNAVKTIRKKNKLTQKELAEKMGYATQYICNIEKCVRTPSMEFLDKLTYVTKIPLFIVFWYATSEDDIPYDKKEKFTLTKDAISLLINQFS